MEYANLIQDWGKATLKDIKTEAGVLNIQHRANSPSPNSSIKAINDKYTFRDGSINRIRYIIRRHLVFVQKGVGKGQKINQVRSTSTRKPKDFFNAPIDKNINALADIVAEHRGDEIVNRLKIN